MWFTINNSVLALISLEKKEYNDGYDQENIK